MQWWRTEVIWGFTIKMEYFLASKSRNGAIVAEQPRALTAAKDVTVNVHHIQQAT